MKTIIKQARIVIVLNMFYQNIAAEQVAINYKNEPKNRKAWTIVYRDFYSAINSPFIIDLCNLKYTLFKVNPV